MSDKNNNNMDFIYTNDADESDTDDTGDTDDTDDTDDTYDILKDKDLYSHCVNNCLYFKGNYN